MFNKLAVAIALSAALIAAPAADAKPHGHRHAHAASITGSGITQPDRPAGVTVVYAPCPNVPDAGGCALGDTIYIKDRGDQEAMAHELGHVVSARYLDDTERAWFMRTAHTDPWFELLTGDGPQLLTRESGEEQFADAYAHCLLGDDTRGVRLANGGVRFSWWQTTPYQPTPGTLRRVCSFIATAMR